MCLPELPSHNNSRAEKSFQENKPSTGRRHKAPEGAAKKSFNSQTMISPSKGPYDILLLQPVGYSLPMRTHIQDIDEQQSTIKVQQYVPHLYTIDMKLYVQICEITCEVFKRPKMLEEQMFLQLKSRGRRTDGYCPRPCLLRYIQLL